MFVAAVPWRVERLDECVLKPGSEVDFESAPRKVRVGREDKDADTFVRVKQGADFLVAFPVRRSPVTGIAVAHETFGEGLGRFANVEDAVPAAEGVEAIRNRGEALPVRALVTDMLEFLAVDLPTRSVLQADGEEAGLSWFAPRGGHHSDSPKKTSCLRIVSINFAIRAVRLHGAPGDDSRGVFAHG